MKKPIFALALALCVTGASAQLTTNNGQQYLLNQALDMSQQFFDMSNTYFTADSLAAFDKTTGVGKIKWTRQQLHARQAFNANGQWIIPLENLDFPGPAYDQSPELQFTIEPVNSRTVRVRLYTSPIIPKDNYDDEVMLVKKPADGRAQWDVSETEKAIVYKSSEGSIEIQKYPWRLVIKDKNGKELTHTRALADNDSTQVKTHPLMWMKRGVDNSRAITMQVRNSISSLLIRRDQRQQTCINLFRSSSPTVAMASSCILQPLLPLISDAHTLVLPSSSWAMRMPTSS